ncbi:MAG: OPT oligopeptide transporter protein [Candidatus Bathyarchaeota archaeon BA1]|nr:MAG: OPT oligopeptide transporter protein [Candidatus Bathyarchaeota archaeon BA1]
MPKKEGKPKGFTVRAVLLGCVLAAVFTLVNSYLSLNFGMGVGFGVVTIFLSYVLFHKLLGNSSKREIALTWIMSGTGLSVAWTIGFLIFVQENVVHSNLPVWLAPSIEAIQDKTLSFSAWMTPILVIFFLGATSGLLGLIVSYCTCQLFIQNRRMVFPHFTASAVVIDSCFKREGHIRFLAYSLIAGFAITFVQYLLKVINVETTLIDLSSHLPRGFLFGIALNVAFIAIGYFISAPVALSILVSSLAVYLIAAPILINQGFVTYSPNSMQQYMNLLYQYTISPGLGVMILGGIVLSVTKMLSARLKPRAPESPNALEAKGSKLGYGELFQFFIRSLTTNRRLFLCFMVVAASTLTFAYHFNFLYPFPPVISVAFTLFFLLAAGFVNFVIITKMAGEAGMTTDVQSILLFMAPLFATGYRGYTGYLIQPGSPSPWVGNSVVGYAKISNGLDLDLKGVVKAVLISWLPSFIASVTFVLVMWKVAGFLTPTMPCIAFVQALPIFRMFAEGTIAGVIDPTTFLAGGALGAVLEAFTPASIMGMALGMLLPPFYGVPFGIGGILRLYSDHKYGAVFFKEKGVLIASGLIAGGILTQVLMSIFLVISGLTR